MKLRIKGNSLRLRVSQTDMAHLLREGSIAETIQFAPGAALTYALRHEPAARAIRLEYEALAVTIVLSTAAARRWAGGDEVGIYGDVDTGAGALALLVEKDFACTDGDDPVDVDAFPNPKTGAVC